MIPGAVESAVKLSVGGSVAGMRTRKVSLARSAVAELWERELLGGGSRNGTRLSGASGKVEAFVQGSMRGWYVYGQYARCGLEKRVVLERECRSGVAAEHAQHPALHFDLLRR
jgi:hypothetical protein